ncbi:MAG: hypothetical protein JSS44_08350 [Proteobacteria bacterium]|nr:hypothetical protein [Pseudomonadota bacterium]MBS0465214.1 hypothetical protein [Pseudomonadota bacterium]
MNGYYIALIVVLVALVIAVLVKSSQRHDPPRNHHWPEGPTDGGAGGKDGPAGTG